MSGFIKNDMMELHRVKYFQIQMMKERGYIISTEEEAIISGKLEETGGIFENYYTNIAMSYQVPFRTAISNVYIHSTRPSDVVRVIYPEPSTGASIVTDDTKKIIQNLRETPQYMHIIIITKKKFHDKCKALKDLTLYRIEHFLYEELLLNPITHVLNNYDDKNLHPFTLYSGDETIPLGNVSEFSIKSFDDPVVKFLGAVVGDVIKIKCYNNEISTTDIFYKLDLVTAESINRFDKPGYYSEDEPQ